LLGNIEFNIPFCVSQRRTVCLHNRDFQLYYA
jgi:hypothetical protein